MKGVGQTIGGARLLFFFHPNLLVRLLRTDRSAIVEAPLKLAVMELPDGTVSIRVANPAAAFARYGNSALTAFGQELAATCGRIISASVQASDSIFSLQSELPWIIRSSIAATLS